MCIEYTGRKRVINRANGTGRKVEGIFNVYIVDEVVNHLWASVAGASRPLAADATADLNITTIMIVFTSREKREERLERGGGEGKSRRYVMRLAPSYYYTG